MERDLAVRLGTTIIQNVPEGILVLNQEGRIWVANAMSRELLGFEGSVYINKTLPEVCPVFRGNEAFWRVIDRILDCKLPEPENCIYTTGEEAKWLRVSAAMQREEGVPYHIIILSDISSLIALQQENRRIALDTLEAMHNFVRVMVTAIDARSPYNATHTRSMYRYAIHFFAWVKGEGKDKSIFSQLEPEAFLCSVWLHDIGKLGIPADIMDKATRLGSHLEVVLHRIDVGILQAKIRSLTGKEVEGEEEKIRELSRAREDILRINQGGPLDAEMALRIEQMASINCRDMEGAMRPLLDDMEKEALLIATGTLTKEERRVMESHVALSEKMLTQMHFSGTYQMVPQWCAGHHELLDGAGYPRHLKGEEIDKETRLLTILDIFDALTAEDRPYKPPVPVKEALKILWEMVSQGKLDGQILAEFEESRAWEGKTTQEMDLLGLEEEFAIEESFRKEARGSLRKESV